MSSNEEAYDDTENEIEEVKEKKKKSIEVDPTKPATECPPPSKTTPKDTKEKKGIKLPPPEDLNILDDIIEKDMTKKKEKDALVKKKKKMMLPAITPKDLVKKKKLKRKMTRRKTKTPKKNKFLGDPWDQLSSWNEKDDVCDKFVPGYPHVYKCKTCSRTIESHRRTAVHEAQYVLAAIDARGEASRVLGQGKDGKGELWLGGQVAVSTAFFEARKIQLCCTIAVGLGHGFRKRRSNVCSKFGTRVVELKWKDNSTQKIGQDELLKTCYEIEWYRRAGKSVLVHCAAGQSRSSTMVIAYMRMFAQKDLPKPVSVNRALEFARKRRPMVRPNKGFRAQLTEFEKAGVFDNVVLPPCPAYVTEEKKIVTKNDVDTVVVKKKEDNVVIDTLKKKEEVEEDPVVTDKKEGTSDIVTETKVSDAVVKDETGAVEKKEIVTEKRDVSDAVV